MALRRYACFILWFVITVKAAPKEDLISRLPGLSPLPAFKQYSGYLDASPTKHLHYWFTESQKDPQKDPVVLWLNGGPGCSSLDGLLSENGPIHIRNDGSTLYMNPYSWNKLANVIYMESPAGVGYSYDDNGDVKTHDNVVAQHNYAALQHFFKKFPEYANNDMYITGESYGGVYLPTLAQQIVNGKQFNFKGFAVGNGLSSYKLNDKSLLFFAYYHGLFGETLKTNLAKSCCQGSFTEESCSFHEPTNDACNDYVQEAFHLVYQSGLNEYALYLDCDNSNVRLKSYQFTMGNLFRNLDDRWRSKLLSQKIITHRLGGDPPCINSTAIEDWLNKPDVRDALHIPKHLPKWDICSDPVSQGYSRDFQDMTSTYKSLLKDPNLRILIYNGDTDMACNFLGDQWFVNNLNIPEKSTRKPWYVDGQVAGFAKEFKQLTYTTIKGAGHMVPQWAPGFAFRMFEKFLNNEPFVR